MYPGMQPITEQEAPVKNVMWIVAVEQNCSKVEQRAAKWTFVMSHVNLQ